MTLKPKEYFKVEELALGECPHCNHKTTFTPTKKKSIYVCDFCNENVRQHINGKVHYYKMSEIPMLERTPNF